MMPKLFGQEKFLFFGPLSSSAVGISHLFLSHRKCPAGESAPSRKWKFFCFIYEGCCALLCTFLQRPTTSISIMPTRWLALSPLSDRSHRVVAAVRSHIFLDRVSRRRWKTFFFLFLFTYIKISNLHNTRIIFESHLDSSFLPLFWNWLASWCKNREIRFGRKEGFPWRQKRYHLSLARIWWKVLRCVSLSLDIAFFCLTPALSIATEKFALIRVPQALRWSFLWTRVEIASFIFICHFTLIFFLFFYENSILLG